MEGRLTSFPASFSTLLLFNSNIGNRNPCGSIQNKTVCGMNFREAPRRLQTHKEGKLRR